MKFWGTGDMIKTLWPSQAMNPDAIDMLAKFERLSASPGAVRAITLLNAQIDVRPILSSIQVPTLVMHRKGDLQRPFDAGRNLSSQIPHAKFFHNPAHIHPFSPPTV